MRHNARPNTQRRGRGEWHALLLTTARKLELSRGKKGNGALVVWDKLGRDKAWGKVEYTSAVRALNRLEELGHVAVRPERLEQRRNQRRAIEHYRLTPSGRRRADKLMAPEPVVDRPKRLALAELKSLYSRAHRLLSETVDDTRFLVELGMRLDVANEYDDPLLVEAARRLFVIAHSTHTAREWWSWWPEEAHKHPTIGWQARDDLE